jgi:hypothetical protein
MKTVKKIAAVILVLIAIPLIVALFVKKEYRVAREITINKPQPTVINYVRFLKNQDHYNKWVMTDPEMKKSFRGTDGSVGFVYAWDGNKEAGMGEQEISRLTDSSIDIEIRFIRPFEGLATAPIITEAITGNQTRVKWSMQGRSKYPLNFMNLFIDNVLGKDLELSLSRLKGILESQQ